MEARSPRSELRKLWPVLLARGSQPTHVSASSRCSAGARCCENTETLPAGPGRSRNRLTLGVGRSYRNPTNRLSPLPFSAPPLPAPAWWAGCVVGPEWVLGPDLGSAVPTSIQSECFFFFPPPLDVNTERRSIVCVVRLDFSKNPCSAAPLLY